MIRKRIPLVAVLVFMAALFIAIPTGSIAQQAGGEAANRSKRRFLLRDEGLSQLSLIDLGNASANWQVKVPTGRDLQLVGSGKVMIGTGNGYEEYDIKTGKKVSELTSFPGTISARRLGNGNTMLAGMDWQGKTGIVLAEVDRNGKVQRLIQYPAHTYLRLVRETGSGTYLITADELVFEGNEKGEIVWKAILPGIPKPHAWQALRLANGNTLVSTGYDKNFQLIGKDGKVIDSISGPAEVHPVFYAGYQILGNGNYIVTNWQGHGTAMGASGTQVLEYTPQGKLVWSWKQDPAKFSSLQGIIVLNGLDVSKMHIEDRNGKLAPVEPKAKG